MRKIVFVCVVLFSVVNSYGTCLQIVEQSATPNFQNQTINFQITFDRAPDFFTVDEYGRVADSFQYYINSQNKMPFLPTPGDMDVVIRGVEIRVQGDIPVRNAYLPDDGSGWGGIAGRLPYVLDGSTLTFSGSFAVIDADGIFSYALETYEYGAWQGEEYTVWAQTPEPATLLLLGLGAVALRKKDRLVLQLNKVIKK